MNERERRLFFHGWAFQDHRDRAQVLALKAYLSTGEISINLHPRDLSRIQKKEG